MKLTTLMHQLSTHSQLSNCNQRQPAYLCQSAFLLILLTSFSHNSWALQWNPLRPLRISLSLVKLKTGIKLLVFITLESWLEHHIFTYVIEDFSNQVVVQTLELEKKIIFFP